MIQNLLAKSNNNLTLLEHCNNVYNTSKIIANIISYNDDNMLLRFSYLHDIYKATKKMQNILLKGDENKIEYLHNEIGWAFLSKYTNEIDNVKEMVFWHHGIFSDNVKNIKKITSDDVLSNISIEEIDNMKEYYKYVCENVFKEKYQSIEKDDTYRIPIYWKRVDINGYNLDTNAYKLKACTISADRLSDNINNMSNTEIINFINSIINKNGEITINNHSPYKNQRELDQKNIVNDIKDISVIKAAAGYGKTFIGTYWSLTKSNKKLIWVCPTNDIAKGVYKNIISELKGLSVSNISLELYLGSKVEDSYNKKSSEDFTSDIIITNIDNYLSPSINNSYLSRLFTILASDVIFDEFHKLAEMDKIFGLFITLMKIRSNIKNGAKTLLLSATPSIIHELWENNFNLTKTTLLPDDTKHYPAFHQNKYLIRLFTLKEDDSASFINLIDTPNDNNLLLVNAIQNSQLLFNELNNNNNILIHSSFEKPDREYIMDKIYNNYLNKNFIGLNNIPKLPDVVSTSILRQCVDLSFNNVYESITSPENTIQVIGRVGRNGIPHSYTINIINWMNGSEIAYSNKLYTNKLKNNWFNYLAQYNNTKLTLDEIYKIYNKYVIDNKTELKKYYKNIYNNGLTSLENIFPIKFIYKKNNKIMSANSNKLRSSGNSYFYTCHYVGSNMLTDIFSLEINDLFDDEFHENDKTKKIRKKQMLNNNDIRYDYSFISNKNKNKITDDRIKQYALYSNSPFIAYDRKYSKIFGIVKEKNFIDLGIK